LVFKIRIAAKLIEEEGADNNSPYFQYIESCFRHKSEMVVYEAAHAIVNLDRTTSRELAQAISVLQLFCGAPKPTLRYSLSKLNSQIHIDWF